MKLAYVSQLLGITVIALTGVLAGCEDEDRRSGDNGTSGMTSDAGYPSQASSQGNDSDSSRNLWRTIIETGPGSGSDTNFVLRNPTTTVDAVSFMQPDGTYLADGHIFTNCDDLGLYFLFLPTNDVLLITNCGTIAFP